MDQDLILQRKLGLDIVTSKDPELLHIGEKLLQSLLTKMVFLFVMDEIFRSFSNHQICIVSDLIVLAVVHFSRQISCHG